MVLLLAWFCYLHSFLFADCSVDPLSVHRGILHIYIYSYMDLAALYAFRAALRCAYKHRTTLISYVFAGSFYSPTGITGASKSQFPVSGHLQATSQTPFNPQSHSSTTISSKIPICDINSVQYMSHGSAQPRIRQEQCGTKSLDNGCNTGRSYGLGVSSISSISNGEALKKPLSPPAYESDGRAYSQKSPPHQKQGHTQINSAVIVSSGSLENHTQIPNAPIQTTISSSTDDLDHRLSSSVHLSETRSTDHNALSTNNDTIPGNGPLALNAGSTVSGFQVTAANAGGLQMGMSMSSSQFLTASISSTASSAAFPHPNTGLSTSASESGLNGFSEEGGTGVDFSSRNGNEKVDVTTTGPGAEQIPNVYINGLPARFPEAALFDLCCEYGPIKQLRTFTRHIGDTESGYGFVL